MKDIEEDSKSYADNVIKAAENGFGKAEAKQLGGEFYKVSGTLSKIGGQLGENSMLGKGLNKLGGLAGGLGQKLSGLAFPIGVISAAVSMTKVLLDIEARYAQLSKEALMTGATMGASAANARGELERVNLQLTNMSGLISAAADGSEFALSECTYLTKFFHHS